MRSYSHGLAVNPKIELLFLLLIAILSVPIPVAAQTEKIVAARLLYIHKHDNSSVSPTASSTSTSTKKDCNADSIMGHVDCVAVRMAGETTESGISAISTDSTGTESAPDAAITTEEDKKASLTVLLTPHLEVLKEENIFNVLLKRNMGNVVYNGSFNNVLKNAVEQDVVTIDTQLDNWGVRLNDEQVALILAEGFLDLPVVQPFNGLKKLKLQTPISVRVHYEGETDQYEMKTTGDFEFYAGESGANHLSVNTGIGKGMQAEGFYRSGKKGGPQFIVSVKADSNTALVEQGFMAFDRRNEIGYDAKLPMPNAESVQAYLHALVLQNGAVTVGDPPAGTNLAIEPIILSAYSRNPKSGGHLHLTGEFGRKGNITVYFQQVTKTIVTEKGKQRTRYLVEKELAGTVLSRSKYRLKVKIPKLTGKLHIVVKVNNRRSLPKKYKILRADEKVPAFRRDKERIFNEVLEELLRHDTLNEVSRAIYIFQQDEGQFRYSIGSYSKKVKIGGKERKMRWMFHLDGQLEDGYKNGVLDIKVSLVPEGMEKEFFKDPKHLLTNSVSLIRIEARKEKGKQFYDANILHDGFAALLGVRWDKDTRTLSLSKLAGFDAKKLGVFIGWDTKAKQVVFKSKTKLGELEVRAGGKKEGSSINFVDREDKIIQGMAHRFAITTRSVGDTVYTVLRDEIHTGKNKDTPKRAEIELAFDSRVGKNEPNGNVDASVKIYAYPKRGTKPVADITLGGKLRKHKLSEANVRLSTYFKEKDRLGLGFTYRRNPQLTGDVSRKLMLRQWETQLDLDLHSAKGKVKLKPYFKTTLNTKRTRLDSITFAGGTEVTYEKGLKWKFKVDGSYTRSRTRGNSWQITALGSAEKFSTEVFVGTTYRHTGRSKDIEVFGGIDIGGIGKNVLKLFDAKDKRRQRFKLYEDSWPR